MTNDRERRHSKSPSLSVPPSPQVPLSMVTPYTQSVAENGHYIILVDLLLPPLPILLTAVGWGSLTIGTLVENFTQSTTYLDDAVVFGRFRSLSLGLFFNQSLWYLWVFSFMLPSLDFVP